mgnify:CR=1 FL=1
MLQTIESINNVVNNFIWGVPAMICIIGVGLYLSLRTGFVQIRKFPYAIKTTIGRMFHKKDASDGAMTPFQAVCTALAGTVGTGNIAGVAGAIAIGGPGAVFWMWLTAILGSASAFIESTLAQIYKHKAKDGSSYGGPAYYIQAALKKRWIGVLFAVVLILTYMGGFNLVASFNIADSFRVYSFFNPEWTPLIVGAILAVVFALAVFGGSKKISQITEVLVPVMGIFYLAVSLFIILNIISLFL